MVSLQHLDSKDGKYHHQCGGSLIHKRWVLTAAHCFYDPPNSTDKKEAKKWVAVLGKDNPHAEAWRNEKKEADRLILHPQYDPRKKDDMSRYNFDIALVELNEPSQWNAPVSLLSNNYIADGTETSVTHPENEVASDNLF